MQVFYMKKMLSDPVWAVSHNIDQQLWKECYYHPIEALRIQIGQVSKSACSNSQSCTKQSNERSEIVKNLLQYLSEAEIFFKSLLRNLEIKHKELPQTPEGIEKSQALGQLMYRCMMFLGDLARYRDQNSEEPKDFEDARRWYFQARKVIPGLGNAHNQLAVLAAYSPNAGVTAVYHYCRAILSESPFHQAFSNLRLFFKRHESRMMTQVQEQQQKKVGGNQRKKRRKEKQKPLMQKFLDTFIWLQGVFFSGCDEDFFADYVGVETTLCQDFFELLDASSFSDSLLLKLVVICIFSIENTRLLPSKPHIAEKSSPIMMHLLSMCFATRFLSKIVYALRIKPTIQNTLPTVQKAPKPVGGRLLGPFLVFCDFIDVQKQSSGWLSGTYLNLGNESEKLVTAYQRAIQAYQELLQGFELLVEHFEIFSEQCKLSVTYTEEQASKIVQERLELLGFSPLHLYYFTETSVSFQDTELCWVFKDEETAAHSRILHAISLYTRWGQSKTSITGNYCLEFKEPSSCSITPCTIFQPFITRKSDQVDPEFSEPVKVQVTVLEYDEQKRQEISYTIQSPENSKNVVLVKPFSDSKKDIKLMNERFDIKDRFQTKSLSICDVQVWTEALL